MVVRLLWSGSTIARSFWSLVREMISDVSESKRETWRLIWLS